MNSLNIVHITCLAALCSIATARPDLSLGYRYNQGHSSGGGNFLSAPSEQPKEAIVQTSYAPTASSSNYFSAAPAVGQFGSTNFVPSPPDFSYSGGVGGLTTNAGGLNTHFTSSASQLNQNYQNNINYQEQEAYLSHLHQHQAPVITKHFYLHSAPEDHDEQQIVRYVNVGRAQKNYRVVFINAPSSTTSKAKIIANVAPVEDKTAIYVLSKKASALDVSAEVVTPAPVNNKPEVFFIKYKTPEEAEHAQHTIQAQYDTLGGSSDLTNEGTVPVSSVIGTLEGTATQQSGGLNTIYDNSANNYEAEQSQNLGSIINANTGINNLSQTYLPAQHK